MHWTGVILRLGLLLLLLARRALAVRRRVLVMGVLRNPRVTHRQYKCACDYRCNVFSHFVWLYGRRLACQKGARQPERVPYKQYATADCFNRRKAEREREGSTARSIPRTKMRGVVRYRVAVAQRLATNEQRTPPPERENSRRRILHHLVPNLLGSQKRQRAR